ncbi:hypothetical protein SLEP1_g51067 [Rubroshorea leprosula]|uniref:HMA domain-containing protein n=1 Tax=Rubroshorea leprosula TaxID=152421 RepID=A0AAV5M2T2_9ROSI|nr:hypothetical protein SLEP1_g51067 [Rubroshorea leprosula]
MQAGSSSNANMTCTLLVDTGNPGWLNSMVKVLKKLEGCVTHFSLDALHGIATISGKIDSKSILKVLNKVGGEHLLLERIDCGFHPPETRLQNNQPQPHPSYAAPTPHYLPPPPELLPKYNNNHHPSYNAPPPHHPPLPPPPAPPRNVKYSADDPAECSIM